MVVRGVGGLWYLFEFVDEVEDFILFEIGVFFFEFDGLYCCELEDMGCRLFGL